jgi:hypothetical protein
MRMQAFGVPTPEDKAGLLLDVIHTSGHVPQCMCLFLAYSLTYTRHLTRAWRVVL